MFGHNTMLLTNIGNIKISELANKEVTIWDGSKWVIANVKVSNEGAQLYTVCISGREYINVTKLHKWRVADYDTDNERLCTTEKLKWRDRIEPFQLLNEYNVLVSYNWFTVCKVELGEVVDKTYYLSGTDKATFNNIVLLNSFQANLVY